MQPKFPWLNTYRGFVQIMVVLVLIAGVIGGMMAAYDEADARYGRQADEWIEGFNVLTFIKYLALAGISAWMLLVQAELIRICLSAEERLVEVSDELARLKINTSALQREVSALRASESDSSTSPPDV